MGTDDQQQQHDQQHRHSGQRCECQQGCAEGVIGVCNTCHRTMCLRHMADRGIWGALYPAGICAECQARPFTFSSLEPHQPIEIPMQLHCFIVGCEHAANGECERCLRAICSEHQAATTQGAKPLCVECQAEWQSYAPSAPSA